MTRNRHTHAWTRTMLKHLAPAPAPANDLHDALEPDARAVPLIFDYFVALGAMVQLYQEQPAQRALLRGVIHQTQAILRSLPGALPPAMVRKDKP